MRPEEIREVVRLTIEELMLTNVIKEPYDHINKVVSESLINFFNGKTNDDKLRKVLCSLSDDPYIDIIYLQFRDGKTLEFVAEHMDKDVSTIKRNKKRIITEIYNRI